MHLANDFKFPGSPELQAEAERRAIIMFGEAWLKTCSQANNRGGARAIAARYRMMAFDDAQIRCWKHKRLQDLADGSPALCKYFSDGRLALRYYYSGGSLNDPKNGAPAVVEYHSSGILKKIAHYRYGEYYDPQDGTPAQINYSKLGESIHGWSAADGKLSAKEATKILKSVQVRRVAALLAKADQSVIPAGMPLPDDYSLPGAGNNIPPKPER